MLSDKEGCFAVASCTKYQRRTQETMGKNFKEVAVSLGQEKKVVKYCHDVGMSVFSSAKSHKDGVPIGAILSERSTWQHEVAGSLQRNLNKLIVSDPF